MDTPNTLPERLFSERLLIRVAKPGDGPEYNAAVVESLAELAPWLHWATVAPTQEASEAACRHAHGCFLLDEDLMAFFFERTSGRLVGGGGLHKADWKLRKFEVGYWCRTDSGGRGLISEAVNTLSDYAMNVLLANRLVLTVDERNIRSWQLAERTGFLHEGTHRNADFGPDGKLRNLRVYAKTAAQPFGRGEAQRQATLAPQGSLRSLCLAGPKRLAVGPASPQTLGITESPQCYHLPHD